MSTWNMIKVFPLRLQSHATSLCSAGLSCSCEASAASRRSRTSAARRKATAGRKPWEVLALGAWNATPAGFARSFFFWFLDGLRGFCFWCCFMLFHGSLVHFVDGFQIVTFLSDLLDCRRVASAFSFSFKKHFSKKLKNEVVKNLQQGELEIIPPKERPFRRKDIDPFCTTAVMISPSRKHVPYRCHSPPWAFQPYSPHELSDFKSGPIRPVGHLKTLPGSSFMWASLSLPSSNNWKQMLLNWHPVKP